MKRIVLMLSILFCITVFTNNSFAGDCPSIKADNAIESILVKLLDETKNGAAYLGTATVDIKGDCVAPIFIVDNKGGKYIGLMLRYPDGTDTDYSDAYVSQLIEVCSVTMLQELMSDPSKFEDKYLSPVSGDRVRFSGPIGKNSSIVDYNNLGIVSYSCSSSGGGDPALEEPEDPAQECGGGEFWDGYDCLQCESYFGSEYWGDGTDCYLKDDQYCEDYYGIGYTWDSTNIDCVCNGYLGTDDICYASGGNDPTGDDPTGEEPSSGGSAPARLRMSTLTPDNADGTIIASGAYAKGAYNANVGNINTALTYVEDSSVETIKHATVSAENVSLSVAGFTPAGTIDVDSSNATVSGTVNVANTVAMLSEWGTNSTENGTLSGSQQVSITNGAVTGMTGSFSGPANGQLSGTGTLSNASVHVNNWVPVNPQQ